MSTSSEEVAARLTAPVIVPDVLVRRRVSHRAVRRRWLVHRALLAADISGLVLGFIVGAVAVPVTAGVEGLAATEEILLFLAALPVWVILAKLHGLYDQDDERTGHSTVDDVTKVFQFVTIGTWVFFAFTHTTALFDPTLERLIIFWITAIALIPLLRAGARAYCRRTEAYTQNTLIVGTGPVARLVARKILKHPEYAVNLLGFVDAAPVASAGAVGNVPVLGAPEALSELVDDLDIERVIVAFTLDPHEETLEQIRQLRDLDVQVDIVPRMFEVIGANSVVNMVEGLPLLGLPRLRLAPSARFLKRALDIVGAMVGLVLLAPFFVGIAAWIKLDSPGPVFFRQVRRGTGDRTFRIYKFRTMQCDAEERKAELAHLNMHVDSDPRMFKIPEDPRVTGVGAWLRRTSIDELPQLLNVLRGEMSLVGPRPLILEEDQYVERWARKRLELKPGITGLWQVLGRSDITFDEMTKLDYLYVTSWSLKEDLRLILQTLPALLRRREAY